MIDDVRIWYTLKTSAEILASMNSELIGTEPGLGAYWNFNEGTGQTAADITGAYMATLGFTTQVESTDPSWNTRGFLE